MAKRSFRKVRDVLNELRWREGRELGRAEVWYADRNVPAGYKVIEGKDITELGRGYFSTADSMLPYYKILRVVYDGEVLFDRSGASPK